MNITVQLIGQGETVAALILRIKDVSHAREVLIAGAGRQDSLQPCRSLKQTEAVVLEREGR